jgi:N4-gp56 family major capsid protein
MYDRAAIEVSLDELIYGRHVDIKTQQRNTGKTFRISRFHHVLDDANVNNQGLDGSGNVIGNTSWIFDNTAYASEAAAYVAKNAYITTTHTAAIIAAANATTGVSGITTLSVVDAISATIAENTVEIVRDTYQCAAYSAGGNVVVYLPAAIVSDLIAQGDVMQVVNGGGNLYGSSRNVGDVVSGLPTLSEGADRVNRVGVTRENFSATLVRQGNFIEYTDEVTMFSDHDMQMEYRSKLARLALEVRDDQTQLGMLGAAGLRFYAGTATTVTEVGESQDGGDTNEACRVSLNLVRKLVKRLKINKAVKSTKLLTGSTNVGTAPVNAAFYGIAGPDVVYDLEDIDEFKAVHEYAYAKDLAPNEVGSLHEMRFLESNRAMKYAGKGAAVGATDDLGLASTDGYLDVFPILVPTPGSYATVGLAGRGKIVFNAVKPGTAEINNPYANKGLFSYNYFWGGLALQPEKLAVLYVGASD